MRLVFIGPNYTDDPVVNRLVSDRIEIAKNLNLKYDRIDPTVVPNARLMANYASFLRSQEDVLGQKIDDVRLVVTVAPAGHDSEATALDGTFKNVCQYQQDYLPTLHAHIRAAVGDGENTLVNVDLGYCLSTLYAAYFCIADGFSTQVVFHPYHVEGQKTFAIGGKSVYAECKPLLRRRLALDVLRGSDHIFVGDPALPDILGRLFPRLGLSYYQDPLTCDPSPPAPVALPSAVGG